jgi:hypothetical protein
MRLIGSASLVLAGLSLLLWVNGSVRGVEANTIGGAMLLLGLVSALFIVALDALRNEGAPRHDDDDDEPMILPRG